MGIPARAAERHAKTVFKDGEVIQAIDNLNRMMIAYRGVEYIFGLCTLTTCPILITVLTPPPRVDVKQRKDPFVIRRKFSR